MIVWINGTFGVGKTTTARHLHELTGWPVFDPEHVGYLVGGHLRDLEFDDFQDLPPWRSLVPKVADELMRFRDVGHLVAVQSVLREAYWVELVAGFEALGHRVLHIVLDGRPAVIEARIRADRDEPDALQWRLDHLERFADARTRWLLETADLVIDSSDLDPVAVAQRIDAAVDR
ncbi:MAG: AAA family ATPase [Actinomycetota bacterium]